MQRGKLRNLRADREPTAEMQMIAAAVFASA